MKRYGGATTKPKTFVEVYLLSAKLMTVIIQYIPIYPTKFSDSSIRVYRSQVLSTSVKLGGPWPLWPPPVPTPMQEG